MDLALDIDALQMLAGEEAQLMNEKTINCTNSCGLTCGYSCQISCDFTATP